MSAHSTSSRRARAAGVVAAAALAVVTAACERPSAPPQEPASSQAADVRLSPEQLAAVKTEPVVSGPYTRTVEATGTVAFDQNLATQVLAPVSGPVSRVLLDVGARVSAGQPLAIVTSPDFAAAVNALRKSESAARNARRIADLDRQLFENEAIARRDYEQAETDAVGAEADRDSALAQLRALGVDARTIDEVRANRAVASPGGEIRSPLPGVLVEKLISPGQLIQAGATPCFTVADLSRVWVLANVFEADLPFVAIGDPAEISVGSGVAPLPGTVDNIAAFVDPSTRAIAVRLVVPNPEELLKRDMYVRVAIRSRRPTVGLLVPVAAVLRDAENLPYVFVAEPGGAFARRRVTIGIRSGDRQEITEGLKPGEPVVVEGALYLENTEGQ